MINTFATLLAHTTPINKDKMSLFRKLSIVKSLPKVAVHEKKVTLSGTLAFQMLFQGKGAQEAESK